MVLDQLFSFENQQMAAERTRKERGGARKAEDEPNGQSSTHLLELGGLKDQVVQSVQGALSADSLKNAPETLKNAAVAAAGAAARNVRPAKAPVPLVH